MLTPIGKFTTEDIRPTSFGPVDGRDADLVPDDRWSIEADDWGATGATRCFTTLSAWLLRLGIRVYHGRVFKLRDHINRLYESAKSINLEVPISRAEFAEAILKTVRLNEMLDGYLRPIVTRVERYAGHCQCCGKITLAAVPEGLEPGTPFSISIVALAMYLRFVHAISYKRLSRLVCSSPRRAQAALGCSAAPVTPGA